MASGVPIIGSPLAIVGLEKHLNSGHIIQAKELDEFVYHICKLIVDDQERIEMKIKARKLVEESFSWEKITEKLAKDLLLLKEIN